MTKRSSAKEFLGTDIDAYRKWIEHHITPEMNWTEIEIDHVKPIFRFDLSKDEELKEVFGLKKHNHYLNKIISLREQILIS